MAPLFVSWVALGLLTLALALYRKLLAWREETYAHGGSSVQRPIGQQLRLYRRIGMVDRWGPTLSITTAVFGLILALIILVRR